jgi:hypothetical protein
MHYTVTHVMTPPSLQSRVGGAFFLHYDDVFVIDTSNHIATNDDDGYRHVTTIGNDYDDDDCN